MEGPQFSTRAESMIYRPWGVDVIGMTNLQEAKLAREAEICYATLAMVTDYDCWHETEEAVSGEAVMEVRAAERRPSPSGWCAAIVGAPADRARPAAAARPSQYVADHRARPHPGGDAAQARSRSSASTSRRRGIEARMTAAHRPARKARRRPPAKRRTARRPLRILITNDDGVYSEGIKLLARALCAASAK